MRVGIVGAGISGLVTVRTFLEEGCDVTVFETEDEVGGVWARSRRYPGLTTQNPRDTYAFSDFPFPKSYPEWPSGEQVQAYLAAYADRFGVTPRVRFGTRVLEVRRRAGREGWTVRVAPADGGGGAETHDFDRVVVCNGVYCEPYVPELPGRAEFEAAGGQVLHSTAFHDAARAAGKRVVVVGFAKSACDVACAAVGSAAATTLVYRRALWKMPRFFFGFVNLKYILTTRFSESLFRYRTLRGFDRVVHTAGRPAVWLFWRGIERVLRATHGLGRAGLVPEGRIEKVVGCTLSLAAGGFYEHVRAGRIAARRGEVARFVPGGVELADGTRVEAEVVVFGTGFRQGAPFLEEEVRRTVQDEDGAFHLYRSLVHPDVTGLGFNGYNSSLYSQLTSEIGARWLLEAFTGRMTLPPREAMLREVDAWWEWVRAEGRDGAATGACVVPFSQHYIDELLEDLGARTRRAGNPVKEWLLPLDPAVYADLGEELARKHARRVVPREPAAARVAAGRDAGRPA